MTSPRPNRIRYRTAAVVMAAALALSACGGSSDEAGPDTSGEASTAADATTTTDATDETAATTTTGAQSSEAESPSTTAEGPESPDTTTVAESLQDPPPTTEPAPTTVPAGAVRPRPELPKDPEGLTEQSFDEAGGLACANAELALFSQDEGDPEGVEDYMIVAREQARASELSQFNDLAPSLNIPTDDPSFTETVNLFLDACVTVGYEVL